MRHLALLFRLTGSGALLLGLANLLLDWAPRGAVDTHMALGILAVLCAPFLLWPLRWTMLGGVGISLAGGLAVLGLAMRMGALGGTAIGLAHLAIALGLFAAVEITGARQRRGAGAPPGS